MSFIHREQNCQSQQVRLCIVICVSCAADLAVEVISLCHHASEEKHNPDGAAAVLSGLVVQVDQRGLQLPQPLSETPGKTFPLTTALPLAYEVILIQLI